MSRKLAFRPRAFAAGRRLLGGSGRKHKMSDDLSAHDPRICVVGLGYVGLPVAHAFARKFSGVIGYDISEARVAELRGGTDSTGELTDDQLAEVELEFSTDAGRVADCNFVVVAVPTPINVDRNPDFRILRSACRAVGEHLAPGTIIVFESTVHPGATEEICGPVLEEVSGLKAGKDFKLAYSPERINPGDKVHTIEQITKVVAGQDSETLETVARTYEAIIDAGVHRASSIKVAEAAKVLENTQRDINIALMNEMAKICHLSGIRTADVLAAAGTKWNFLPFTPGLVGGHCIGVDPYYLTAQAERLGYHPEVILAGRRINDGMPRYIATELLRQMATAGVAIQGARVGVLGATFKENVPDVRNSKSAELLEQLRGFGMNAMCHDPLASPEEFEADYGLPLVGLDAFTELDALVYAVPHRAYADEIVELTRRSLRDGGVFVDIKSALDPQVFARSYVYWSL